MTCATETIFMYKYKIIILNILYNIIYLNIHIKTRANYKTMQTNYLKPFSTRYSTRVLALLCEQRTKLKKHTQTQELNVN